jgi:hypothetical protein
MQLLCTFTAGPGWQADYDAAAETRQQAGLTQLQLWHDADDPGRVLALYQVNDRARAAAWVTRARSLDGLAEARFLTLA